MQRLPAPAVVLRVTTPDAATPAMAGLPVRVLTGAGLDPAAYRDGPLRRRVGACLRAIREDSERAACERLDRGHALAPVALDSLLIGVSAFFRDEQVFRTLRDTVVPILAQRGRPLRVVSIGCSSGAELYSVAMLLAEARLLDRASLIGVDCRPEAVRIAISGVFDAAALATVEPALRSRYLEACGTRWRVVEALRRRTMWEVADATRTLPPGPYDLLLCRNLFIYLRRHVADAMLERMVAALSPGGVLVVGKAERPPASLRLRPLGPCVYRAHVG